MSIKRESRLTLMGHCSWPTPPRQHSEMRSVRARTTPAFQFATTCCPHRSRHNDTAHWAALMWRQFYLGYPGFMVARFGSINTNDMFLRFNCATMSCCLVHRASSQLNKAWVGARSYSTYTHPHRHISMCQIPPCTTQQSSSVSLLEVADALQHFVAGDLDVVGTRCGAISKNYVLRVLMKASTVSFQPSAAHSVCRARIHRRLRCMDTFQMCHISLTTTNRCCVTKFRPEFPLSPRHLMSSCQRERCAARALWKAVVPIPWQNSLFKVQQGKTLCGAHRVHFCTEALNSLHHANHDEALSKTR